MARPSKYNSVRTEQLLNALRLGCSRRTATCTAGISEDTLSRWIRNNADFAEAIARAEEEAVARNIALVAHAARKNWRAAAWWLERTHPELYRLRTSINMSEEQIDDEIEAQIQNLVCEKEKA